MTKEPLYIISGEQLDRALAYRIRVLPFMCPDERKEWERFIASCRSRPYNEQEIRQAAINGVLDKLTEKIFENPPIDDGVQYSKILFDMIEKCRQQSGEQQRGLEE